MINNKIEFLDAANWAFKTPDSGINIRRIPINANTNATLLNASKGLLYDGYTMRQQQLLKGLIVLEENNTAVDVLACCFEKFFNMGEPNEKGAYLNYLHSSDKIMFYEKVDGVNIRPWFNPASNRVEFATRGMPLGTFDEEENDYENFGLLARQIAEEKYPILLDAEFIKRYSLIFEMIHPNTKILTDYGDRKDLVLLSAFDLTNDCKEATYHELISLDDVGLNRIGFVHKIISNLDWNDAIVSIQNKWLDTDLEGTVIVFADNQTLLPKYRLKLKNVQYLRILRIAKFCTLKNTREIIEERNLDTWDKFRTYLYESYPDMNEELEMGYKTHYDNYTNWLDTLNGLKLQIEVEYKALPKYEIQKDFALHVVNKPFVSFFFALRKADQQGELDNVWNNDKLKLSLEKILPLTTDPIEDSK